jgi:hypothetical protein
VGSSLKEICFGEIITRLPKHMQLIFVFFLKPNHTLKYVDEVLKLMAALTGDYRFENCQRETAKGGSIKMCEVLDKIENRGIAKGRAEGRIYGMVTTYLKATNLTPDEIANEVADETNEDIDKIKQVIDEIKNQ